MRSEQETNTVCTCKLPLFLCRMNTHIQISVPLLFLALYILGGYLEHALKISPVPNRPVALSRSYNDSTVPRLHPTAEHLRLYLKRKEMNDNIQSNQFVILHMYVVFDVSCTRPNT